MKYRISFEVEAKNIDEAKKLQDLMDNVLQSNRDELRDFSTETEVDIEVSKRWPITEESTVALVAGIANVDNPHEFEIIIADESGYKLATFFVGNVSFDLINLNGEALSGIFQKDLKELIK